MLKSFRDKVTLSGVTVLMIGVALLIFTFLSAYAFLTQNLQILASTDLVRTFGEALAPLIATGIRIMYLGVMGWVASLLTIRGVTIIANAPKLEPAAPMPQPPQPQRQPAPLPKAAPPQKETKPEPKPEPKPEVKPEPKPEAKPSEPEIILIPPDEVTQPPSSSPSPEQKPAENNNQQQPQPQPPPQPPSNGS